MRNKRTVWSINTQPSTIEHFAMFPSELVETMIEAGCRPGGVVLDMFFRKWDDCDSSQVVKS